MKSEMKLNYEHLFELATLEVNVVVENSIFFSYTCRLNTTVCEFNNFSIGAVNEIQKKFVHLHEMG